MGYINKHHSDILKKLCLTFTPIGSIQKQKNAFSGGSYVLHEAKLIDFDLQKLVLKITVKKRNNEEEIQTVDLPLDSNPIKEMTYLYKKRIIPLIPTIEVNKETPNATAAASAAPMNNLIRKINRLCYIMNEHTSITGKLTQLGIQIADSDIGKVKKDLYLNQVPHNRYVRRYFYDMVSQAVLEAVVLCSQSTGNSPSVPIKEHEKISNRMKVTCLFPELNTSMDAYRIGTLLEMARQIGITLAEQNVRVRICVQGSMGQGIFTGVPKALSGVQTLLQRMDWQSGEGEENEGMVGNYINFGAIGKEHVVNENPKRGTPQDDVFLLICPQSMQGVESSIIEPLKEMVEAAGDRPVILLNPDLTDKVSSQGQQSVRGRQDRMDFADSFQTIFHFQCTYLSGTSYFPILGALTKTKPLDPWVTLQRRDLINNGGEVYVPTMATESKPEGEDILSSMQN
eukprot:CAMPEP_0178968908 /NCGR_PEP_ID=MMETSP0789-20121207/18532_1 /TAXON_ID=3005 /ORGANISM="Rhizosolenia setigera, Strain CCMP 1694" /LENGTH=454 /DNA_ID=CAMNT_0020654923 /DNA_START=231 /DNA_END=1595 /DNA_ORIENTATION=-